MTTRTAAGRAAQARPGLRRRRRRGPRCHRPRSTRRRRRAPRGGGRGRPGGHPLLRVPPGRLPGLALGGHGDPGAAQPARHGLRDRAAARRRTRCWRPAGCRGTSGCSRATWASATCMPTAPDDDRLAPGLRALRRPGGRGGLLGARPGPAPGDVPRGPGRDGPALVRRRATAPRRRSRRPRPRNARCGTCGFYLPLAGSLRQVFGVCGNLYAPDDGRAVSADHGCGAHSEVLVGAAEPPVEELPTVYDDSEVERSRSAARTARSSRRRAGRALRPRLSTQGHLAAPGAAGRHLLRAQRLRPRGVGDGCGRA